MDWLGNMGHLGVQPFREHPLHSRVPRYSMPRPRKISRLQNGFNSNLCTWFNLFIGSRVLCVFCFELALWGEQQSTLNLWPNKYLGPCIDNYNEMHLISPDGYEKMRALKEDGRPSDDSWLIFCIFDKGTLILFSGSAVLLCGGSVVCCSLIVSYYRG